MRKRFVSIKPLISPNTRFLGLEKYGMVLFDGAFHKEMLTYRYVNGIKRYITGLDEFAPEITSIQNDALKKEKIKYIRKEVSELEMQLIYNHIDPNDPDFWSKVKKLLPTNEEFWSKVQIKIDNFGLILDIENNPEHRILYHCIKAGGFTSIAPSYQMGLNNANKFLFYLDSPDEKITLSVVEKKIKNKSISILENLENENNKMKLFYLAKILLPQRLEISFDHSIEELYTLLDNYIQNNYNHSNKLQEFIDYAEKKEAILKVYAMLYDMIDMKTLYNRQPENQYFCNYTQSFLGKNLDECVGYLTAPANAIVLNSIIMQYQNDLSKMGFVKNFATIENENSDTVKKEEKVNLKDIEKEEPLDLTNVEDFMEKEKKNFENIISEVTKNKKK